MSINKYYALQDFHNPFIMMKFISVGLLLLLLLVQTQANCPDPTLIIPNTFLDKIFDQAFSVLGNTQKLRTLISNPNISTLQQYGMTQLSYLIPLWTFAGLSFIFMIACIIQNCCYNCCHVKKCGRKLNYKTYSPCSVSCSVYLFMIFSFLLIGITITAFIISSDLLANLNDTTCDFQNTYNSLYSGTPAGTIPSWSGVSNFNNYANGLAINFPNSLPLLNSVFQASLYTSLTSNSSTSLYQKAMVFNCPTALAANTVSCPFPDVNSCVNSNNLQIPIFSQNYCGNNVTNSASSMIQAEMQNTTNWKNSLQTLQQNINSALTTSVNFNSLVTQTQNLASGLSGFKSGMQTAIDALNNNFQMTKIGSYIAFSIIIFLGLVSFLSICCVFCTRNFNCRFLLYPLWILFGLLSIIFFVASSAVMFGSFTTFGLCSTYQYYTATPSNLLTLSSYNDTKFLQVMNTCFSAPTNSTESIFTTFSSSNLTVVNVINSSYNTVIPSTFTTVTNTIVNNLAGYALNPNTANLEGASTAQNPQAAQDAINSDAATTGFCGIQNSAFQYNPTKCSPLLISQNPPTPSCILINNNNLPSVNSSLSCIFDKYQALQTFGGDIQSLATSYQSDAGLNDYRTNYFNYYEGMMTLLNTQVKLIFASFLEPYNKLIAGSPCSFITSSLNFFVDTNCNREFPQIYAISSLVTAMSICFFFMMILSYYLTTRMQFYGHLNGDFSNYDQSAQDEQSQQQNTVTIQMADMSTNRNQLLVK